MTCCELVKSGATSRYYLLGNQSKHFPFRQGQRKLTRFIFGTDKCMDGWAGITSSQNKAFLETVKRSRGICSMFE